LKHAARDVALVLLIALVPRAALAEPERSARIVVLQSNAAEPYAIAVEEIRRQLEPSGELHLEWVGAEEEADAGRIRALEPDVLVSVGSRATAWALAHTERVPVVFSMVLNPVASGLAQGMKTPGGRLTGAALDVPPDLQFRTLRRLVRARRVAVLYNPERTGVLVREAVTAARREGVELVPIEVSYPRHLKRGLARVDRSFDALWSVADPTILARGLVEHVLLHTLDRRIPFMGLSEQYVRAGALLALSTSYAGNGRQAAGLVQRILDGEDPASLPILTPAEIEVVFNPRTAERLELELADRAGLALRAVQ
jgi:putative ABC transport system substrate-binding protein